MPDSNIWVYLIDAGALERFRKEAKRLDVAVAACPAIAFEFLRARLSATARKQRIDALTRTSWKRLMPEAFTEAEDTRMAITRRRPAWLNPAPDTTMWFKLKADWEHGWWRRVRGSPHAEAQRVARLEGNSLTLAKEEARERRKTAFDANLTFDPADLDGLAVPTSEVWWWDGKPFEPWRIQFATIMFRELQRPSAYADWLEPWLKSDCIDVADWYHLWLREVTREELPRAWLRWAFEWVHSTRKTSPGTPVDNQIATYLPECDVFVTADKVFAESVEALRPHSPVRLGGSALVPANSLGVDAVFELMKELSR